MDDTDARVLVAVGADIPTRDLETTVRTLRGVREGFENAARWRRVLTR